MPMSEQPVEIIEYTDPLCSIAWGTEPFKRKLQWRFGEKLNWRPVMAGLCKDNSTVKMFQPWDCFTAGQQYLKVWKRVTGITGMPYPEDLRYMAVTTGPPCLLVKAAELQGSDMAEKVLRRFRESVFFYGTPVDSVDQAAVALEGIPGLDIERLLNDAKNEDVKAAYLADWEETRDPNDYVRGLAETEEDHLKGGMMFSEGHERYSLPTFIFKGPAGERTVPGYRPYAEYEEALEAVAPGITKQAQDAPTPEQAVEKWSTMTSKEIEVVCGSASEDPSNAKRFEGGGAHVWLNESEADYWATRQ
ncbi:MAG: putative DsbA family dithiol-disulfide isomerase [Candidatus Azotimanducaceae bacterium]|jgi:predicted DsbA family dithiol-disulfide isomerase